MGKLKIVVFGSFSDNSLNLLSVRSKLMLKGNSKEHVIICLTKLWSLVLLKIFNFGSVVKLTASVFLSVPSQF